jgi:hypothetical protein
MFSELFSSVSNVSEAAALYDEALTSLMDAYHSKVSTFATAKSTKTVTLKTKKAVAPAKAVAPVAPKAVAKATSAKKSLAEEYDLHISDYSDNCFILWGNTKPIAKQLGRTGLKGSYCALAESDKIPESKYVEEDAKRKHIGWFFSKKRLDEVCKELGLNPSAVNTKTYKKKESKAA